MTVPKSYLNLIVPELKTVLTGVYTAVYDKAAKKDALRQQLHELMSSDQDCFPCDGNCDVSVHRFSVDQYKEMENQQDTLHDAIR